MIGMNRPMKRDLSTPWDLSTSWCMDGEVMLWSPILHFSSLKMTQHNQAACSYERVFIYENIQK